MFGDPVDSPFTRRIRQWSPRHAALRVAFYLAAGLMAAFSAYNHWTRGDTLFWIVSNAGMSLFLVLTAGQIVTIRRQSPPAA